MKIELKGMWNKNFGLISGKTQAFCWKKRKVQYKQS